MNWQDLREIRRKGLKPSLPVLVTTRKDCWTYAELGFAVVHHEAGKPFPAELLDGLRVLLFLGDCDKAQAVVRMLRARQVKPAELRTWCPCYARLDRSPVSCEVNAQWA